MIIAIDGPAGSGKSTVAKLVAKKLGFFYLDTGAMYRAVAYKMKKENLSEKELIKKLDNIDLKLLDTDEGIKVILDGEDITEKIRTEEIGKLASKIAKIPKIREKLVQLQRKIALEAKNAVLEGRDIGTVVFPDAELKIFMTASPEERAKRRYLQLKQKGENPSYEDILKSVLERDKADMERKVAPLKPAKDAIVIDTTNKTIEEVVDIIVAKAKEILKKN